MKNIFAYAHTHWDREWYQPFETFRTYLVHVLRQILDDLEAGKLSRFYLDGQAVILEDALAIAPELEPRIKALMDQGELAAGPWYVMPDEMLVCGESLIRNLKLGIASVRKFGKVELVGYSPDTFGHTQDLPRILNGFGINSAFLWRGVPQLSYGPCFWWQSPDGSKVLAYHLSRGYYQTSLIEKTRDGAANGNLDELSAELAEFAEDRRQWDNVSLYDKTPDALLLPIGADHTAPPRNLSQSLLELNKKLKTKGLELKAVHLSEFADLLEKQAQKSFSSVGMIARELRDNAASAQHANAFLLPGVLSTRLYLKRENREAERRMFRMAEPFFSFLSLRRLYQYPQAELNHAIRLLLKNHPHDSICGCSVDAVHDEMLIRYARFHQVVSPLLEDASSKLAGVPAESATNACDPDTGLNRLRIINASPKSFTGPAAFKWYELPGAPLELPKDSSWQLKSSQSVDQLFAGWGHVPYYKMLEEKQGWIWVEDLPAFSEMNLSWPLKIEEASKSKIGDVKLKGKTLDNGILKVFVDEKSQLSVVFRTPNGTDEHYLLHHLLRDTGDGGDTYNYDPLPGDKPIHAKLLSVQAGQKGPLRASLLLKYEIQIPESVFEEKAAQAGKEDSVAIFKRSQNKVKHEIETEVLLAKGSRILEFETTFLNQSSGHRLEVLFSTGAQVHCSYSENHFSLLRRYHQTKNELKTKLPVPRGSEAPCDRFPAQRFVVCNNQVFLNKGLPEYGVEGDSFVLTLLRSVPILSRGRMQTRGGGAGPHLITPGSDCKGLNKASYAWSPIWSGQKRKIFADSLDQTGLIEAFETAEAYEQEPVLCLSSLDDTSCPSLLRSENPVVRVLSFYQSDDREHLILRLQNLGEEPAATKLLVDFDFQSAHLCRFDEEVGEEVFLYREYVRDEITGEKNLCTLEINFGANEVKTIKMRLTGAAQEKAPAASRTRKKRTSSSKTG